MSLTDILYEAVEQVEGAHLAGVVSTDGLGVDMVMDEDELPFDVETAEAELGGLAAATSLTMLEMGGGYINDIVIEADYITYLLSLVVPGYFVVLGIHPEAHLGRARFAARQMVSRLQTEL